MFTSANRQSAVHAQPSTEEHQLLALQAAVACPTGSIRTEDKNALYKTAARSFPTAALDKTNNKVPNVYYNGNTSKHTFGASSWLSLSPTCNIMFDCPRYSEDLANRTEELCGPRGIDYIALSHCDDVFGHHEWAERLGAKRIIHEAECNRRQRTTECEIQLTDNDFPFNIDESNGNVVLHHVPGHTRGSIVLLDKASQSLFSGDHCMGNADGVITSSLGYCFYSWSEQLEQLAAMADLPFVHLWPGHGRPHHFADEQDRRLSIGLAKERLESDTRAAVQFK